MIRFSLLCIFASLHLCVKSFLCASASLRLCVKFFCPALYRLLYVKQSRGVGGLPLELEIGGFVRFEGYDHLLD